MKSTSSSETEKIQSIKKQGLTDLATDDLVKLCLARQWIEQKTCEEEDNDDENEANNSAESENESIYL